MAAAVLTARLAAPRRPAAHHLLAGAAGLAAAGHLLVLALLPHSLGWSLLLAAMTLWCIKCAWRVARGCAVLELQLMCAAMGAAHVAMTVGLPWFSGHHAGHAGHAASHAGIMLLAAAIEFALMFASALVLRKRGIPAVAA